MLLRLILYAVIVYFAVLAILYFFQKSLIYYPDQTSYTPEQAGVPEMEAVTLATADGLELEAWYAPSSKTSFPTIVYFHGNAGNIAMRGPMMRPFIDWGYGVLLVTYRGYSGNPGGPHEQGLYKDARAALQYLQDEEVSGSCTVLYGNSIGAAVAVQMAVEFPTAALVLQSPFSSIADVARYHYPIFSPFLGLIGEQYDSLSKAKRLDLPVLIVHGKEDRIIPPELSRKLTFAGPLEAEYIPGKGHNDLWKPEIVDAFLKKYVECQ